MGPVLIVALVVGAVLPALIGVAIVVLGTPKRDHADWSMARAFAKGIALGIVLGATVSAIVIVLVLAGAWWLRR
jgi:uncharacterized membrane protein YidH (DUF202 family)